MRYAVRDLVVVAPHKCNYATTCGGGETVLRPPPVPQTNVCNKPDDMDEADLHRLHDLLAQEMEE